jgi:hypothetical protein
MIPYSANRVFKARPRATAEQVSVPEQGTSFNFKSLIYMELFALARRSKF